MNPAAAAAAADKAEPTEDDVIINLKLLKRSRYYDLIVPDRGPGGEPSWSVFGSGHRAYFVAAFALAHSLVVLGNAGFALPVDYALTSVEFFLILFADLLDLMTGYKTCLLFYRVREVAALMDVTRVDFLSSAPCRRNRGNVLRDCRARVVRFTDVYCVFCAAVVFQWILIAGAADLFGGVADAHRAAGKRVPSVINMPFPADVSTYNRYYPAFFASESFFGSVILYCMLMIDTYLLSYGWIITAQYEVLARAFESLGRRGIDSDDDDTANVYEDLKSILADQLKLFSKLKSFNAVARPIILTIVAVSSVVIVILTFVFIIICSSSDSFSIVYLFKVGNVDLYLCIQLYLYSDLIDNMNEQRESVNVAIYSSDWTDMDLKVKKLLLLAMRMNDANRLHMKASPRKLINLQLFASVMSTCYNITSVMVKSLSTKS